MNNTPHEKSKQKNGEFIPNFTQYPNEILDNWMPHLSGNQTKIVNVFVRQIYGYHKDYDRISVRQISSKTGIPTAGVFRDLKILLSIGVIRILKKGDKSSPHTYQIVNITKLLSERTHNKKDKGVIGEITGCYRSDNSGVIGEITEVLSQREQQKKEINIKESVKERELEKNPEHTQGINFLDPKIQELAQAFGISTQDIDLSEEIQDEINEIAIPKKTEAEINTHYSNEIAKVEQELARQSDIILPKLSTGSLLKASEDFLRRIGIGFDHSPRRILNLIYKNLPSDFVIKEDSKDVEILGDMIKKYMASRQDERESIAKRIYRAVEAMLKIYVIKKYGEPYREVLYPEILRANLVLYLNCNPTFKYCLGGFSNDIDGVYTEVCRLAEKDAKKKIEQVKIEHSKKIRQLEANRQAEIRSMFSETEISDFQRRNDDILRRMDAKGDIEHMPLAKPIQPNLTEEEKQELNMLFVKGDKTNDDVIRMNFLIKKSRKL